jgi:hypothetical protein
MDHLSLPEPATAPVEYHWNHQLLLQTSDYSPGRRYPVGGSGATYSSQFDFGEGFTGERIRHGNHLDFEFDPVNFPYTGGPLPKLEVLLAGRNEAVHNVEIMVGSAGNFRSLGPSQFQYLDNFLFTADLSWSDITAGSSLQIRVSVTSSSIDHISVSYIRLTYPEMPDMEASIRKTFELEASDNEQVMTITSTSPELKTYDITDPDNVSLLEHTDLVGSTSLVIPGSPVNRKILVERSPVMVPVVQPAKFRNINPASHDYLIITHNTLQTPSGNYPDPVRAYADYRASDAGGGHDTLVVDMDMLYDQFNYGEISPLAIRYFVQYMLAGNPQHLLLIGKGYNVHFKPHRQDPLTATTFDL